MNQRWYADLCQELSEIMESDIRKRSEIEQKYVRVRSHNKKVNGKNIKIKAYLRKK